MAAVRHRAEATAFRQTGQMIKADTPVAITGSDGPGQDRRDQRQRFLVGDANASVAQETGARTSGPRRGRPETDLILPTKSKPALFAAPKLLNLLCFEPA
jgi:hypothetical protein